MAIERRPEWGVLVLTSRLKYRMKLALKRSLNYTMCHGSAGTPLGTHANGEDSGLEESRKTIRT
jgi:hypothetical protein